MIYSADHFTGATGVIPIVFIAKGGTQAYQTSSGVASVIASGLYSITLSPGDTNTLGDLAYLCQATNCDSTYFFDEITGINLLASSVTASASGGGVNVTQWAGGTLPTPYVTGNPIVTVASGTVTTLLNPVAITGGTISAVTNVVNPVTIASQQVYVKKNAALSGFMFLMLQSSDHVTPATGLTITSKVSINGAAFVSTTYSATEVGSGVYTINLAAADTNGNTLMYLFTGGTADNRYIEVITQS